MFTSPLISRTVALLLLATALLVAYVLVVEPIVLGYGATGTQIEEARDQLSRFERAAAMRPALIRQMDEFQVQEKSRGYYLTGRTDALAAAALQGQVHALISDKGGSLESVQPLPGVEERGLIRVTLRVQMTGTTDTLFDILYGLESRNPILFIDNVDIQSRVNADQDGEATSEAATQARLSIAFDLSGYLPKESE